MGILVVKRRIQAVPAPVGTGTQGVSETLVLANPTYVEFDPEVFSDANTIYTIFTYGTLLGDPDCSPSDPVTEGYLQASNLAELGFSTATFANDVENNAITVTFEW